MANMRNTRFLEYSVRILTLKLGDNPIRYGTLCSYDPILTSRLGRGVGGSGRQREGKICGFFLILFEKIVRSLKNNRFFKIFRKFVRSVKTTIV